MFHSSMTAAKIVRVVIPLVDLGEGFRSNLYPYVRFYIKLVTEKMEEIH